LFYALGNSLSGSDSEITKESEYPRLETKQLFPLEREREDMKK
jgi:hypothetical protein